MAPENPSVRFCGVQWCCITYSLPLCGFFKILIFFHQILISQFLKYLALFGQKMANFVSIQEKGETSPNGIFVDHRMPKWGYLSLNPGEYWPFGPFFKFLNTVQWFLNFFFTPLAHLGSLRSKRFKKTLMASQFYHILHFAMKWDMWYRPIILFVNLYKK